MKVTLGEDWVFEISFRRRKQHGRAFYKALHGDGLKCPYGCIGTDALTYGLVSHLMEKHNHTEKLAWEIATRNKEAKHE
jgi:hypothetical protein